jgi:hypothetical protein
MSVNRFGLQRIGLATEIPRGRGVWIPQTGTAAGGGEFGARILDEDRTFAITREPVAHRIVFTVAHDIFDNWFKLELEGKEQDEAFDKQIQTELSRLKAKQELMRMATFERCYGWAILVLGYADSAQSLAEPLTSPQALEEIKAYSPMQVPRVDEVRSQDDLRYGLPEYYNIKRSGIASYLKVHYTRVIHFANRLIASDWKGMSVLDPVWDDLVTLRNIRWGMGQTMYRYGSGFPDITFTGAEKADIDDFIASGAFSNLSARTYFVHNENQLLDFKGIAGRAIDPMNYYLPIMENISAGSGIPLAILRGAQAGALTGSEVNQQEYYGLVSDEQSGYEQQIRELVNAILKLGNPRQQVDFKFNWKGGFELDEQKKAQIDLVKAQTLQVKGDWMTRNEIRKLQDPNLPDLTPEQGGDELLSKAPSGGGNSYLIHEIPKTRQPITNPQSSGP